MYIDNFETLIHNLFKLSYTCRVDRISMKGSTSSTPKSVSNAKPISKMIHSSKEKTPARA